MSLAEREWRGFSGDRHIARPLPTVAGHIPAPAPADIVRRGADRHRPLLLRSTDGNLALRPRPGHQVRACSPPLIVEARRLVPLLGGGQIGAKRLLLRCVPTS